MGRKRSNGGLYFLSILLIAAMYASAFFCKAHPSCVPEPFFLGRLFDTSVIFSTSGLSAFLGSMMMAITAASLLVFQNRFTSGFNFFLPLLYLILCLTNPGNIYLTPIHFAAFLTLWALFYLALFKIEKSEISNIFASSMLLLCAAVFYMPVLWLAPIFLIYGFGEANNKAKYLISFIFGLILPLSAIFCLDFLINDAGDVAKLHEEFRTAQVPGGGRNLVFTAPEICHIAVILLTVVISFLHVIRNVSLYKVAKSSLYSMMMVMLPIMAIIAVIFLKSNHDPIGLLIFIPASILVFEFFTECKTKNIRIILTLMFISLIAVERAMSII
jgi:hypothetical protein